MTAHRKAVALLNVGFPAEAVVARLLRSGLTSAAVGEALCTAAARVELSPEEREATLRVAARLQG